MNHLQVLLKDTNPWMLTKYILAHVGADGNCLFRSVSYALYDIKVHHIHLRLLCVIEALLHEQLYNGSSVDFYGPCVADKWLRLPAYDSFVCSVHVDGSYSDMLSVLALSSVTQTDTNNVSSVCSSRSSVSIHQICDGQWHYFHQPSVECTIMDRVPL